MFLNSFGGWLVRLVVLPEDDISNSLQIFAPVLCIDPVFPRTGLPLPVALLAVVGEVPLGRFKHVCHACGAHWHNHLSTAL